MSKRKITSAAALMAAKTRGRSRVYANKKREARTKRLRVNWREIRD